MDCVRRLGSLFRLLDFNPWVLPTCMQQRQRLKNLDRPGENWVRWEKTKIQKTMKQTKQTKTRTKKKPNKKLNKTKQLLGTQFCRQRAIFLLRLSRSLLRNLLCAKHWATRVLCGLGSESSWSYHYFFFYQNSEYSLRTNRPMEFPFLIDFNWIALTD